jgi:hypothetical protein
VTEEKDMTLIEGDGIDTDLTESFLTIDNRVANIYLRPQDMERITINITNHSIVHMFHDE